MTEIFIEGFMVYGGLCFFAAPTTSFLPFRPFCSLMGKCHPCRLETDKVVEFFHDVLALQDILIRKSFLWAIHGDGSRNCLGQRCERVCLH